MPQEETQRTIVIQKNERDRDRICTLWGVTEPSMFILETCDGVISTMKNTEGELIGVLTEESPSNIVIKNGYYEVCVIGKGTGTVYVIPYAQNNVDSEDCCDELRDEITNIWNEIANIWEHIRIIEEYINNGEGCCDELRQEITNINTEITNIWNRINAFDIVAGSGISVTKNGNVYTITNTSQDGTITTLVAGDGISITDDGTGGNHNYTITNTGGSTECCEELSDRIDNITIQGGTGISVTKQGDNYTIINTAPGSDVTVPNEVEVVSVSPNIIVTKRVV